jgi:hypothetical protein
MDWGSLGESPPSYIVDENKHMDLGIPRAPHPYFFLVSVFQLRSAPHMYTDLPPLRAIIYGSGAQLIVPLLPVSRLAILFAELGCLCILIVLRAYGVDPHHFLHFCARVAGTVMCFFFVFVIAVSWFRVYTSTFFTSRDSTYCSFQSGRFCSALILKPRILQ